MRKVFSSYLTVGFYVLTQQMHNLSNSKRYVSMGAVRTKKHNMAVRKYKTRGRKKETKKKITEIAV